MTIFSEIFLKEKTKSAELALNPLRIAQEYGEIRAIEAEIDLLISALVIIDDAKSQSILKTALMTSNEELIQLVKKLDIPQ